MRSLSLVFHRLRAAHPLAAPDLVHAVRELHARRIRRNAPSNLPGACEEDLVQDVSARLIRDHERVVDSLGAHNPELAGALVGTDSEPARLRRADRLLTAYIRKSLQNRAADHFRASHREQSMQIKLYEKCTTNRRGARDVYAVQSGEAHPFESSDAATLLQRVLQRASNGRSEEQKQAWARTLDELIDLASGRCTVASLIQALPPPDRRDLFDGVWPPTAHSPTWARARDQVLRRHSRLRIRLEEALKTLAERRQFHDVEVALARDVLARFKRR